MSQVWPLFFDLAPGTEAVLSVGYEPQDMGVHEESLVVVCDNCQVRAANMADYTVAVAAVGLDMGPGLRRSLFHACS